MSAPTRSDPQVGPLVSQDAAAPSKRRTGSRRKPAKVDRFVVLAVLWMGFEWCRPPTPFKVPMLISVALLASWLLSPRKHWRPQVKLMVAFMALSAIGIPLAGNYFSAYVVTRVVGIIILCIAIPMSQFIDTIPKLHTVLLWMVLIFAYVGLYALTDGGNGPGGRWAGMDENYTSMFMSIAIAMAYFMMFATRSTLLRIGLVISMGTMIMATVIGLSRGGFLGLVAVGAYSWYRSPKKLVGIALAIAAVGGLVLFAPASYWQEMNTIQDTDEGTSDMRLELWKVATWQFAANPVIGVGAGNFPWETFHYETQEQVEKFQRTLGGNVTHSLYFELLAEQGTVGVLIFLALIYYNARDLRYVARMTEPGRVARMRRRGPGSAEACRQLTLAHQHGRMLAGALIGFFVCSAFVSTLYYSAFWLVTALVVSLRIGVEGALAMDSGRGAVAPREAKPDDEREPSVDLDRSASLSGLWSR